MKKTGLALFFCGLVAVGFGRVRAGTNDVDLGQTTVIINLLRSHYVDRDQLGQKLLNDATVDGLLQALGRGAQILTPEQVASNAMPVAVSGPPTNEPLARVEVIDPDIGYIRLADISANTVTALDAELKKFSDAKVAGYILDLRFVDGTNFAVAAELAGRFLSSNQELFALKRSTGPSEGFRAVDTSTPSGSELKQSPLMILINASTRGSAEALAGAFRATDRGILVGGKTDGSPLAWEDIKLEDGRVLRVATAKIELSKGGPIFPGGLVPDIPVKIDPQLEKDAVLNGATNQTLTASLRPHEVAKGLSEAELVKAFRGESTTTNTPPAASDETDVQQVRDVVLQRAVDILKGIRVLVSSRGE